MRADWAKRLLPVACAAGAALIVAAALLWYPPLWQRGYAARAAQPFAQLQAGDTVNVNTADITQLCLLPGIGEAKAQAIIDHRQAHGPFQSVEDLTAVPGIGPAIAAGLEGLVSF